jgi:hypothetical protein
MEDQKGTGSTVRFLTAVLPVPLWSSIATPHATAKSPPASLAQSQYQNLDGLRRTLAQNFS